MPDRVPVQIWIDADQREALRTAAKEHSRSMQGEMRHAFGLYLRLVEKQRQTASASLANGGPASV